MSNIQTLGANALQGEILEPMTPSQAAALILQAATDAVFRAKTAIVKTEEDYARADADVAAIKKAKKASEAKRLSYTKPLKDTAKQIEADFAPGDAKFDEGLELYRRTMSAFQAELARQRAEAEALARKERERLEAEAKAKADVEIAAAKKAQEEAEAAKLAASAEEDPFAALLAEQEAEEAAQRAAEQSEAAKQAIRYTRVVLPAAPEVAKVTGSASKTFTAWKYEITDPALVPLKYRPIDEAAIARDVRALKEGCEIPGVRVYSEIEVK